MGNIALILNFRQLFYVRNYLLLICFVDLISTKTYFFEDLIKPSGTQATKNESPLA